MKHRTRRLAAALIAAPILLAATPAHAATTPLWPCAPIDVRIDMPDPGHDIAYQAVRNLIAATPRIHFAVTDNPAAAVTIRFGDPGDRDYAAVAVLSGSDTTMIAAQVIVRGDVPRRMLKATVLHELGHVAGLDHARPGTRSVMSLDRIPWRSYQPYDRARLAKTACR